MRILATNLSNSFLKFNKTFNEQASIKVISSSNNVYSSLDALSNYNSSFAGRRSTQPNSGVSVSSVQDKKETLDRSGVYVINWDGRYIKYNTREEAGSAFGISRQAVNDRIKTGKISDSLVRFVSADCIERKEIDKKELQAFIDSSEESSSIDIESLRIDTKKISEIASQIRELRPNPFYNL